MADTRPTHEIETPVGKTKVVLRDWLTGGEKRKIAAAENSDGRLQVMVAALVVSVDGDGAAAAAKLDDMHGKDFDFVMHELTKITEGSSLSDEEKKR